MSTSFSGAPGRFGTSHAEEDFAIGEGIDEADIDIDFNITESGRTVAHLVDESGNVVGDFNATDTDRTVGNYSSGGSTHNTGANPGPPATQPIQTRSTALPIPTANHNIELQSGSAGSGTSFLSDLMKESGANLLSHTPPNFTPSSYEAQHFGKRARSGSISGRLRSASELEESGIIDHHQKGILKDLIISGDEELQTALDKYEHGDKSTLENMVRSGALLNRASTDIDLLDELDLDFLTVDDDVYAGMEAAGHPIANATAGLPQQQHLPDPIPQTQTQPSAMAPPPKFPTKQQVQQMAQGQPNMVSPAYEGDDGIGELDFNADFVGQNEEHLKLPPQAVASGKALPSPNLLQEQQRFRSNSLAFGDLLGEPAMGSDGRSHRGWVDQRASVDVASAQLPQAQYPGMQFDGLVFQNPAGNSSVQQLAPGGIAATLADYGRSMSDSKIKTKAELAEERRRVKREKKEQKDREKREKKERREQESREKKARDAREKQERKERKAAERANRLESKDDGEERKETPSGLGRPRSMSDPNLKSSMDMNGLLQVERPDGWIGAYSPESRKIRIERFMAKRNHRVWTKTVKYDVRKNFADSRLRVKGRFVKKEDEMLMRELMSLT